MSDPEIDRSLIDAARDGLGPTREERDRLRRAVGAAIAGATVSGAAASAAASAAAASTAATTTTGALALGATWKLAAVALVAVGVIGGATWSATTAPETVTAAAPAPAATEPEPVPASRSISDSESESESESASESESESESAPVPTPDSHSPTPPRAPALSPPPSPAASSLLVETRLLRDAHAALRAGAPARALALLDDHATRFPDGALREERLATRIAALCDAGDVATARAETARFLAAHPRSLHAPRVRAACGATPP